MTALETDLAAAHRRFDQLAKLIVEKGYMVGEETYEDESRNRLVLRKGGNFKPLGDNHG